MELMPSYKKTEVGVIPEDWQVIDISDLCGLQRGFDITEKTRVAGDVPVYSSSGISYFHNKALISPPGVVTGRKGILGKVFFIEEPFWPHDTTLWVKDFKGNHPAYVALVLKNFHLERLDAATSVPTLNRNNLVGYPIPHPTAKAEQAAIAEALSDADALIESLEQLIAKKRQIKQGAMQELLTQKKRLPGFRGEWEVKRFGDVAFLRKDRIDPRRAGVQAFCIELEHIEQGSGHLVGNGSTGELSSLKTVFQRGDVLFGKLRAYLRKYWLADCTGVCSTEIWAFVANLSYVLPEFLFQLVTVDQFIEIASTAYGTHMPRSDWKVVKSYEVALPKLDEQTAIASILSDMDSEIASLETKLAKYRQIKQGMMQELLTGRIRLV